MDKTATFQVNKELFSKIILLRACYIYIENYYLFIEDDLEKNWKVTLTLKNNCSEQTVEELKGEFNNTLINEAFREELTEQTRQIKEMIVAKALFGADNRSPEAETEQLSFSKEDFAEIEKELDDYLDDPLGIATPWEEKYGKDEK